MEKSQLRKQIREIKKQYTPQEKKEKSVAVWKQIEENPHFKKAQTVLAYWSMEDEVYTHEFVQKWASQKTMLLPCVRGEELDIRCFESVDKLCPGEAYAIPEPVGQLFSEWEKIDLVLVPGVAFDQQGNRLGRGKGYYDKILKQLTAYKIGISFDFQLVGRVPVDGQDVKMDHVIWEH